MTGGYAARAAQYADEIRDVPQPAMLAALLRPGMRIAEMPSGTGHFLPAYTAADTDVTLVDSCPEMLREARRQAVHRSAKIRTLCTRAEELALAHGSFDLIVMPNAALNQLAADSPTGLLLTAAARALEPGGTLLAQVLDPGMGATCGFYDPGLADRMWREDREFPGRDGQQVTRRRRQEHLGNGLIRIDFVFSRGNRPTGRQSVVLRHLSAAFLRAALISTGLTVARLAQGASGLTEVMATRPAGG